MMQIHLLLLVAFLSSTLALAAPKNQDEEMGSQLKDLQMLESSGALTNSKFVGVLDVRPTASLKGQDSFRFENSVEIGYQFSPVFSLVYHQDFWTNLYNSTLAGGSDGIGLQPQDGFFDWYRDRVLESSDKTLSLSYEGRLFVPTMASRQQAGMITALRTYFILGKKLGETVSLNLVEAPIIHAYSQASHGGKANPLIENRIGLQVSFNLSKELSFTIPLSWSATKMRSAPGNKSSNAVEHFVWVNPELSYAVNSNYSFGMGYYDTTSLISSDLSSFQIGEGLEDGVVQVFLRASL
jgi:hypothetical protein